MPDSDCCSWETHLESYLLGNLDSLTPLYKLAKRSFLSYLSRRAPFMPPDLREEAFDQVFVRLLENPPEYDSSKCSLRSLMRGLARNALRQVRALYAPAGQKTRISVDETEFATTAAKSRSVGLGDGDELVTDPIEEIPSYRWTAANAQAMAEASELLSFLPEDQGAAAWMVHGRELSVIETSAIMGKSRFAVARVLKQAFDSVQRAAA
jgi:DNA-directed RNA polymerase specialized sigma24 family protein